MSQANVSRAKAVRALKNNSNDIVNAIMVSGGGPEIWGAGEGAGLEAGLPARERRVRCGIACGCEQSEGLGLCGAGRGAWGWPGPGPCAWPGHAGLRAVGPLEAGS